MAPPLGGRSYLLAAGWLTLLGTNFFLENDTARSSSAVITGVILSLLIPGLIGTFFRAILQDSLGLFHGTLARAMIPVFAVTLLLIGPLGHHYLKGEEGKWIRADRFIASDDAAGFSFPETELTEKLTSEMKAGLASVVE